jgi:hypothetical protein
LPSSHPSLPVGDHCEKSTFRTGIVSRFAIQRFLQRLLHAVRLRLHCIKHNTRHGLGEHLAIATEYPSLLHGIDSARESRREHLVARASCGLESATAAKGCCILGDGLFEAIEV